MLHRTDRPKLTLVVLAAGMGSRYGGAKQADSFGPNGELLLDYSLYDAWQAGFSKAVFVIREELRDFFSRHFTSMLNGKMEFQLVEQRLSDLPAVPANTADADNRKKPWGTGHALWAARDCIDSPFAVINADDFYGRQSYIELAQFMFDQLRQPSERPELTAGLVGFNLDNTLSTHGSVARGVCQVDAANHLLAIEEHTDIQRQRNGIIKGRNKDDITVELHPNTLVSMNMWGFPPAFIAALEEQLKDFLRRYKNTSGQEFYLPAAVNDLLTEQRCRVQIIRSAESWQGVTYAADKQELEKHIKQLVADNFYPDNLLSDN
ncbi:MAG: nucleotidyltransferase family protein [Lentisphaeria bacterium]